MTSRHAKDPTPVDKCLGERVRTLRVERGLTQEALADAVGVTFQQVQKYERGFNRIAASRLVEIAVALNLPLLAFFEGAEALQQKIQRTQDFELVPHSAAAKHSVLP